MTQSEKVIIVATIMIREFPTVPVLKLTEIASRIVEKLDEVS